MASSLLVSPSADRHALVEASVAPSTLSQYTRAIAKFVEWMSLSPPRHLISTSDDFDEYFCDFIVHVYDSSGSRQLAVNALYGIAMIQPRLCRNMDFSKRLLQGWNRMKPTIFHRPIPWYVLACMMAAFARDGELRSATALLLGFDCYLRVSEITALKMRDISLPGDQSGVSGVYRRFGAVHIRQSKTGVHQYVMIRSPALITLLKALRFELSDDDTLVGMSTQRFRTRFKKVCKRLNIESLGYNLHGLKHGGATHDALCGMSLESITSHGRWMSSRTARRYTQCGRALMVSTKVPDVLIQLGTSISDDLARNLILFSHLPAQ